MDVKIVTKTEQPLLARTSVRAEVRFSEGTPKRNAIAQAVASELKAKPDVVLLKRANPRSGEQVLEVEAFVYKNAKAKEQAPEYLIKRAVVKEEAKTEEAPTKSAEAAPEKSPVKDASSEEKVAEVPVEGKVDEAPSEAEIVDDALAEEKIEEAPGEEKKEAEE